jgi:hypothetical protein
VPITRIFNRCRRAHRIEGRWLDPQRSVSLHRRHRAAFADRPLFPLLGVSRRFAQYAFIRALTALRAAALIPFRARLLRP